jgi:hypothetical protein
MGAPLRERATMWSQINAVCATSSTEPIFAKSQRQLETDIVDLKWSIAYSPIRTRAPTRMIEALTHQC